MLVAIDSANFLKNGMTIAIRLLKMTVERKQSGHFLLEHLKKIALTEIYKKNFKILQGLLIYYRL